MVQLDYAFLKRNPSEELTPMLVAIDDEYGKPFAMICEAKGVSDISTVKSLKQYLDRLGLLWWRTISCRYVEESHASPRRDDAPIQ